MKYLYKEDIVLIDKMTVNRHGGNFVPPTNFLNEGSLSFLVDAVKGAMFGAELYPTVWEKAGLYMYNVVSNHIFQDGNKRAGLGAALLFLKCNNYQLKTPLSPLKDGKELFTEDTEILIHFTLKVASSEFELSDVQEWFRNNIESKH